MRFRLPEVWMRCRLASNAIFSKSSQAWFWETINKKELPKRTHTLNTIMFWTLCHNRIGMVCRVACRVVCNANHSFSLLLAFKRAILTSENWHCTRCALWTCEPSPQSPISYARWTCLAQWCTAIQFEKQGHGWSLAALAAGFWRGPQNGMLNNMKICRVREMVKLHVLRAYFQASLRWSTAGKWICSRLSDLFWL